MTTPEKWVQAFKSKDSGYIPTTEYISRKTIYIVINPGEWQFKLGDRVKLVCDPTTSSPLFINQNGVSEFCCWYRIKPFIHIKDK